MRYYVTLDRTTLPVDLGEGEVRCDGELFPVELFRTPDPGTYTLHLAGSSRRVIARRVGEGKWRLHEGGRWIEASVLDERSHAIREMTLPAGGNISYDLRAPMPGLVVRVLVEEGDEVAPGEGIVIVEAMKMENELKADAPGVIGRLHVAPGDTVEKDQLLVGLRPADDRAGRGATSHGE